MRKIFVIIFTLVLVGCMNKSVYISIKINQIDDNMYKVIEQEMLIFAKNEGFDCNRKLYASNTKRVCLNQDGQFGITREENNASIFYSGGGTYFITLFPRYPDGYKIFEKKLLKFISKYKNDFNITATRKHTDYDKEEIFILN